SWAETAQLGEFTFHRSSKFRSNHESFTRGNNLFFEGLGYKPDQFVGKTVVDLGAGSKLRAKFFEGAHVVAVEPLANKFVAEIEWCDLKDAEELYSEPAEKLIAGLVGRVDFLFSINVLDHCFDFQSCIQNIREYLRPGGTCFLAFDCHSKTDDLHPIIVNERAATDIIFDAGFQIDKFHRMPSFHRGIATYAVGFYATRPE
ncbi:MAG TPA: methyltransferase domain-containing protein, partial [Methylomirabilota bacterium]|nr:methyltransferase domain-containing protein [Methylomirabilota bacterium]